LSFVPGCVGGSIDLTLLPWYPGQQWTFNISNHREIIIQCRDTRTRTYTCVNKYLPRNVIIDTRYVYSIELTYIYSILDTGTSAHHHMHVHIRTYTNTEIQYIQNDDDVDVDSDGDVGGDGGSDG
jgi:hypothetical protein